MAARVEPCQDCRLLTLPYTRNKRHVFSNSNSTSSMNLTMAQQAANNGCELLKWILKPLLDDDVKWIGQNPTALSEYYLYCDFGQPDERGRTVISEFGFLDPTTEDKRCRRKCRLVVYNPSDFSQPVSNIDLDTAVERTSNWLRGLETEDHTICRPQSLSLPTTVIEIKKDQNPGGWHLTLVDNSKEKREGSYAALTYTWGGRQEDVTTRANFGSRCSCIDYHRLSKTIQDAIQVTYGLGIPYLWVDSQCILQQPDNAEDYDKEEQRKAFLEQADIYSNAAITISASRSENNNTGFINELSFKLSIQNENTSARDPVVLWKLNSRTEREPVYTRGWTFQEYKLSRRMVFFESYQLRMACCCQNSPTQVLGRYDNDVEELRPSNEQISRFAEEDGGLGDVHQLQGELISEIMRRWNLVVERYSRRTFTSLHDKYPAIIGLGITFMKAMECRLPFPSAIWLISPKSLPSPPTGFPSGLPANLLWTMKQPQLEYSISTPTWSWIPSEGDLDTTYTRKFLDIQPSIAIREIRDEYLSRVRPTVIYGRILRELFVKLQGKTIKLSGRLLEAELIRGSDAVYGTLAFPSRGRSDNLQQSLHLDGNQDTDLQRQYRIVSSDDAKHWTLHLDPLHPPLQLAGGHKPSDDIPVTLLLFYPTQQPVASESLVGLILRRISPHENSDHTYIRIGVFEIKGEDELAFLYNDFIEYQDIYLF